jgi:hypothetical protein
VTVVAVHNGDFDVEVLGGMRQQFVDDILRNHNVQLVWWDAGELLHETEKVLARGDELESDAAILPPGLRPFARRALDSLRVSPDRREQGFLGRFDLRAVDELIGVALPLDRETVQQGGSTSLTAGKALKPRELALRASELAIFASMVSAESNISARGLSLPTFDAVERCVCAIAEHARRFPAQSKQSAPQEPVEALQGLLMLYRRTALALRIRLEPILDVDFGLARGALSETIDYPLRTLRLLGHLAIAGLACLDEGSQERREEALLLGDAIMRLWDRNEAACASPVTDDQGIEIGAIWALLLRLDRQKEVGRTAQAVIMRLAARRVLGLPMPALYHLATEPMDDLSLRVLVEAHLKPSTRPAGFEDGGSTLLALASYLAYTFAQLAPSAMAPFDGIGNLKDRSVIRSPCFIQAWQPPVDGPDEWYAHGIFSRGFTKVFDKPDDPSLFLREFEAHAKPVNQSFAEKVGLPVLDWIAWRRWRTLPTLHTFCRPPAP